MNKFCEVFKTKPVVLPVNHVVDEGQAIKNVLVAQEGKSDGVFLINHTMSSEVLLKIYESVVKGFSDFWIGINCLGWKPGEVFNEISRRGLFGLSGVWTDNAMINEYSKDQPEAERIHELRRQSGWEGLYFGGVAFKYQKAVSELEKAAQIAVKYVDVVTTSGPGTGHAAEIEKIRRMKSAIGEKPLAIASGITPENVSNYIGISDCFLVATGISKNFYTLDPQKLKMLVENIRKEAG